MSIDPIPLLQQWSKTQGLVHLLGIRFETTPQGLDACIDITPDLIGGPGVAHGGVLTALLDTGMGAAVLLHSIPLGKVASTLELKTNFLRPTPMHASLRCQSQLMHIGGRHVIAQATVVDTTNQQVVALATGTFNLYSLAPEARDQLPQ